MNRTRTLGEWTASRTPPVPAGFRSWITPANPDASASVTALLNEALHSLESVRKGHDRPRSGAFDLLAADGFVTWACEAALDDRDPAESLATIVETLLE